MERCADHDIAGCSTCAPKLVVPKQVEGIVVRKKAEALSPALPQAPALDPVTVYLSRFTTETSRRTMLGSLRVLAAVVLQRETVSAEELRTIPWHEFTYAHSQEMRNKLMKKGYSAKTTNKHLVALRGILNECGRLGRMTREAALAATDIDVVRGTAAETGRRLSDAEVDKLFTACGNTLQGKRDAAVLALLVGGGLRRSEVTTINASDWDSGERQLKVLGKGNKWRTVYLSKKHTAIFESWLEVRRNTAGTQGALVNPISKWGTVTASKGLTSNGVYDLLKTLAERAGVASFTPHDLRRTFITRTLEKTSDTLTVSKMVGHANVQTTSGYDKRGEAAKKAIADLE
jgi:hypothetical protein